MTPPADDAGSPSPLALGALLLAIAAFGTADLVLDRPARWLSPHTLIELGFVALCLAAVACLWRGWMRARRGLEVSAQRLAEREAERDAWRRRTDQLLRGLGAEIEAQLARWSLTPAEQEVALLLLKGLGHKEIASVTARSERTVRQHAVALYRKAGVAGRAELSAFFLEDLIPERPATTASSPETPS